jgi:purine-nucleoside/S-methyl-5'-thioadenosine phosphorylase / adenosine deaminase
VSSWLEEERGGLPIFRPTDAPSGVLVAFSGRSLPPPAESAPTAALARRLARALRLDGTPMVRGSQVHGRRAVTIERSPAPGEVVDAGECDILATSLVGVALVVQTADCVPVVLAAPDAVATAHAGWRGTASNAAAAAVHALARLGSEPATIRAWLGPSIGPCCYEVGGETASRFAGQFLRATCQGRFHLNLAGVNRAQLEEAGVRAENISVHPSCTRCGGEKYASYRRNGSAAGRMVALVARFPSGPGL